MPPPTYANLADATRLHAAWLKVLQRGKRGGIDGKTVEDFENNADKNLALLLKDLTEKRYTPEPYLSVSIAKKDGGSRGLGMLTVRDKIVQQALTDLLQPTIEPRLNDASFAYRPRKGVQQAVQRVAAAAGERGFSPLTETVSATTVVERAKAPLAYALRCDVKAFFDTVPHDLLEKQMRFFIKDNDLVQLCLLCMGMGKVDKNGKWVVTRLSADEDVHNTLPAEKRTTFGLPQGGVLSPLLSNLYLHQLDWFVHCHILKLNEQNTTISPAERRATSERYTRYADDFVLLFKEKNQAESASKKINAYLEEKLRLTLGTCEIHSIKTGFLFLGLWFDNDGYRLNEDKKQELAANIRKSLNLDWKTKQPCTYFHHNLEKIHRYQAPVLNDEQKAWLDAEVCATVSDFLAKNKIADRKLLKAFLDKTPFLTPKYRAEKQAWVAACLNPAEGGKPVAAFKIKVVATEVATPINTAEGGKPAADNKVGKSAAPHSNSNKNKTPITTSTPVVERVLEPAKEKHEPAKEKQINPQKIIAQKKREYEKRESANMELVVTRAGASIGLSRNQLTVRINGVNILEKQPTANIRYIAVTARGVSISSNAITYCSSQKIPIVFYGENGKPEALLYHHHTAKTDVWLAQAKALHNLKGANIAKIIATAKINNQINLLKYFAKNAVRDKDETYTTALPEALKTMEKSIKSIDELPIKTPLEKLRQQIMGHEGVAAAAYWKQWRILVADNTDFQQRQHQGARDLVNNMLNYGYGILYGRAWTAALNAKLHPDLSFLHTEQTNTPALTFDLVEPFRAPIVDRAVASLIARKEELNVTKDGLLTEETRKRLAEKVLERLNTFERYKGEQRRVNDIMNLTAQQLAQYLQDEVPNFKPYRMKW